MNLIGYWLGIPTCMYVWCINAHVLCTRIFTCLSQSKQIKYNEIYKSKETLQTNEHSEELSECMMHSKIYDDTAVFYDGEK